jgi:CheY-like chemotaxis protein
MLRVFIVDDDRCTRETYARALQLEGYQPALAETGAHAIEMLGREPAVHGMVLDLRLPDMTGFDVLRWMRGQHRFVPTAVVTAFRVEFDPDEAIELGALAYADQPLSIDRLITLARALTRPPSTGDQPNELHRRVCAGDPAALECLCTICLQALPPRLERAFPRAPWDFAVDAVSQACFEYGLGGCRRIQCVMGVSVLDVLCRMAWRNLRDRIQSERSRTAREQRWGLAQLDASALHHGHESIDLWATILAVTANVRERCAAELWLDGASSKEIASVLGVGHLSATESRQRAKQFKDRLIKRLSRYIQGKQNSTAEVEDRDVTPISG